MRGLSSLVPQEHLVTGPTREPLDLDEVKKLLNYQDSTTDDTLIDGWISAARQHFETETGRQVMLATWENWLDRFPHHHGWSPAPIEITRPPLQAVLSIQYVDTGGVLQTWDSSNYTVRASAGPRAERGTIVPVLGVPWPQTRHEPGAVRVQYLAGYGNALADIPELIRSTLYLIVANFHCARCANDKPYTQPPLGMDQIIRSFTSTPVYAMQAWDC